LHNYEIITPEMAVKFKEEDDVYNDFVIPGGIMTKVVTNDKNNTTTVWLPKVPIEVILDVLSAIANKDSITSKKELIAAARNKFAIIFPDDMRKRITMKNPTEPETILEGALPPADASAKNMKTIVQEATGHACVQENLPSLAANGTGGGMADSLIVVTSTPEYIIHTITPICLLCFSLCTDEVALEEIDGGANGTGGGMIRSLSLQVLLNISIQ